MKNQGSCRKLFQVCKPYAAMISLQFGYAGMNILTKFSLNHGMSHYVLVVYRHAFATLSIAPFALILERKVRPRMTFAIFMQIFVLGLLGMEKLDLKKVRCQAKVVGTLVTVAGAMLMTLYKGPIMEMVWNRHMHAQAHQANDVPVAADSADKDWFKGCIFLIIATLAWASLFVLQAATLRRYNAPLSLTSLICFVGTLQAIAVTFVTEHKLSVWRIGWDMNLLAAAYAGIVTSSIAYYVQGLVIQDKGPVFASAFSPLMMILVAIMGSFILAEKIYLGGVIGAVLIVVGLYSVLWGKHKENREKAMEANIPVSIKGTLGDGQVMEIIELDEVDLKKAKSSIKVIDAADVAIIPVNASVPANHMKVNKEER
ncbi:auxin-induced protein [Musa troglodytarum]|uniref:WAT1-related protein n=1 Tax=Musa troglodytarum TaxID=320322 RepID=A0A9E7G7Z0_9LILI|nr:auxin-induced protein [Musa troglodytarum]